MQASAYLNKLPERLTAEDRVLVVDPMLATGKPPANSWSLSAAMTAVGHSSIRHAVVVITSLQIGYHLHWEVSHSLQAG